MKLFKILQICTVSRTLHNLEACISSANFSAKFANEKCEILNEII